MSWTFQSLIDRGMQITAHCLNPRWQIAAFGTLLVLFVAGLLHSFAARSGLGETQLNRGANRPDNGKD